MHSHIDTKHTAHSAHTDTKHDLCWLLWFWLLECPHILCKREGDDVKPGRHDLVAFVVNLLLLRQQRHKLCGGIGAWDEATDGHAIQSQAPVEERRKHTRAAVHELQRRVNVRSACAVCCVL